jgi:4-amino-4-deoxy-L-arabinose transferase-like glycosyltransferase
MKGPRDRVAVRLDKSSVPSRRPARRPRTAKPTRQGDDAPADLSSSAANVVVIALTVLAAALHIAIRSHRPLWLDEACTYWTIQIPALQVLQGVRTDGTPPLHFLLVGAATGLFGSSEFVLRLVSVAAATALVPASFAVTRLFASRRTAAAAAAVATISPLVHYFSVEARSYALVQLETVAILYALLRALRTPERLRWWGLLILTETLQLWTHSYAVFVVAVLPLLVLLVASHDRTRQALYAAGASTAAALLALPPLLSAVRNSGVGIVDWVADFWLQTPPAAAIPRSLEVFGFGGAFPPYLDSLGPLPQVRWLGIALTALLLVAAVAPVALPGARRGAEMVPVRGLVAFLLLPLSAAWLYSALRQPLYLVGRYDTIVLPAFLILIGVGLERLLRTRWWVGAPVVVAVAWLSVTWFNAAADNTILLGRDERLAAEYIARTASPSDPIVTTSFRRAVFSYYLDRAAHPAELFSFPSEIAQHPGYYNPNRLLADPARLATDGEHLAQMLASRARQGATVWVLTSDPSDVDGYLYRPLITALAIDETCSRRDLQLACMRLR